MTRKNSIIPFDPDDGLDYRFENMLMRMVGRKPVKPPLPFGSQFEENERFVTEWIAEMKQRETENAAAAAAKQERKEERQWLREGHDKLKATRKYLRDRKAPSSAGRASTPGKSSPR